MRQRETPQEVKTPSQQIPNKRWTCSCNQVLSSASFGRLPPEPLRDHGRRVATQRPQPHWHPQGQQKQQHHRIERKVAGMHTFLGDLYFSRPRKELPFSYSQKAAAAEAASATRRPEAVFSGGNSSIAASTTRPHNAFICLGLADVTISPNGAYMKTFVLLDNPHPKRMLLPLTRLANIYRVSCWLNITQEICG